MVATKQTIHGSTFERGLIQVGAGNAQPCLRFRLPLPSPPRKWCCTLARSPPPHMEVMLLTRFQGQQYLQGI